MVLALAAALTYGGTAQAQETLATRTAKPPLKHACVFEGMNLNKFLGVRQRLIGPPPCREAFVDEKWVRTFPAWGTAASAKGAVYPPGYRPARRSPMTDFKAKFRGVRIVNDIGTARERSYTFSRSQVLRRVDLDVEADVRMASFATPPLRPLSAGAHTTTVFIRLSAQHCDGLGTDPDANCLPGGESQYTDDTPVTFFPHKSS
ncbi:hypothetical protein [Streptomyces sp. NPDC003393]